MACSCDAPNTYVAEKPVPSVAPCEDQTSISQTSFKLLPRPNSWTASTATESSEDGYRQAASDHIAVNFHCCQDPQCT